MCITETENAKYKLYMKKIAIFASGSGTNAEKIAEYFQDSSEVLPALILSNKKNAFVLKRAEKLGIPSFVFSRKEFYDTNGVMEILEKFEIDLIVLAGFLWLVPDKLLKAYPGRIINIHPALLPKYGGEGMYGEKVHSAVIAAGEKYSGITIHYVNEVYDAGEIIFQEKVEVTPDDTPDSLASRIHALEYQHYPVIIKKVATSLD